MLFMLISYIFMNTLLFCQAFENIGQYYINSLHFDDSIIKITVKILRKKSCQKTNFLLVKTLQDVLKKPVTSKIGQSRKFHSLRCRQTAEEGNSRDRKPVSKIPSRMRVTAKGCPTHSARREHLSENGLGLSSCKFRG